MKQGDKFIVKDNSTNVFEIGDLIECISEPFIFTYEFRRISDGLTDYLYPLQIKPIERFPCDDEQPNIE